jgi:hypothetical protein
LTFLETFLILGIPAITLNNDYSISAKLQLAKINFILLSKDPAVFKKYTNDMSLLMGVLENLYVQCEKCQRKSNSIDRILTKGISSQNNFYGST